MHHLHRQRLANRLSAQILIPSRHLVLFKIQVQAVGQEYPHLAHLELIVITNHLLVIYRAEQALVLRRLVLQPPKLTTTITWAVAHSERRIINLLLAEVLGAPLVLLLTSIKIPMATFNLLLVIKGFHSELHHKTMPTKSRNRTLHLGKQCQTQIRT